MPEELEIGDLFVYRSGCCSADTVPEHATGESICTACRNSCDLTLVPILEASAVRDCTSVYAANETFMDFVHDLPIELQLRIQELRELAVQGV